jgi:hypothetical protein
MPRRWQSIVCVKFFRICQPPATPILPQTAERGRNTPFEAKFAAYCLSKSYTKEATHQDEEKKQKGTAFQQKSPILSVKNTRIPDKLLQ